MGAIDRVFRGRRPSQERPLAAIIAGLWKNNEQGVWYDSSDLSTMYQDLAGTTPVYMPGQGQPDPWIGLQLDKRLGLVRGQERLTNGDFTSTAGWVESGVGVALSAAAGELQITSASPLGAYQQPNNFVVGRWYVVTGQIRVGSSASVSIRTVAGGSSLGTMVAESQVVTSSAFVVVSYIFQATNTSNAIYLRVGTTNSTAFFKSLSVRELPGNHRWQGTATSRPVLSARYNLLVRTEDFSATAWGNLAGGTGSVPVKTPNYATAPNGTMTATRVQLALNAGSAIGDISGVSQGGVPVAIGASYSGTVWLKASSQADVGKIVLMRHAGGTTYHPCALPADWTPARFGRNEIAGASTAAFFIGLRGASGGASDSVDMLVWGADLRPANDGVGLPPYQRVIDANTYDTTGFPLYRKPDGVDDWMQTAAVDFSVATQITVAAALRKMSDAARAVAIELGTLAESTAGNYSLEAPSAGLGNVLARASGTSVNTVQAASLPAPAHVVVQARLDPASGVALRTNAGPWAANPVAFGGGFAAAPLYFDRRAGTSLPSAARDYGTLIVGRLLTGPETAAVEKFLRQKSRAY